MKQHKNKEVLKYQVSMEFVHTVAIVKKREDGDLVNRIGIIASVINR
jgi:hypothetical protein